MSYDLNNLDELQNLSDKEKEYAIQILKQLSEEGSSELYEELIYQDFKERPVDIITFIKDNRYLGKAWHLSDGTCKLFPFWEEKLQEIFPDNITTNVNTFIASGARGIGKSEIAVTCALYLMHRLMCLKDPHTYLNLKPTEQVAFAFMNITEVLAMDIGTVKFQNTVQASPWFMDRGTLSGTKEVVWNPPSFLKIIIGSQPRHVIGQAVYFAFFDEISFIPNQDIEKQKIKALDLIDTAIGGMKTRFTNKGKNPTLLCLASSKRSEKSFLEEHIKKKAATDKEGTLIVDEPVWNVRPSSEYSGKNFLVAQGNRFLTSQVLPLDITEKELKTWRDKGYRIIDVPIEYYSKFLEDIDRALCDYAGISSSELTTYISGVRLLNIKKENLHNPFTKDIIEVGNGPEDTIQYYNFFDLSKIDSNMRAKPLYIHLDMSINGDKTGIAGVWIKGKKPPKEGEPSSKELYYQLAFSIAIKAPKGYQVSFEKNRQFIYWLKEQGFNIKGISSDTFQSADLSQQLIAKGYVYSSISVDRVDTDKLCKPYHYLRNTIYEERIEIYESRLLTEELLGLERNNNSGKIDHSPLGINSKDTADALCGAVWNASQNGEQFAFDFGETIETIINVSQTDSNSTQKKQIQVAFEEELTKLFDPINKQQSKIEEQKTKNEPQLNKPKSPFKDFGLGPAEVYKPSYLRDGIMYW